MYGRCSFLETTQSAGGHLPLILLDDARRSSFFVSSPGEPLPSVFYFPLLSRQFILSPSSLLSLISFTTKAHIHGSAKPLNRTIFLVCRFSSCVVRCKFARTLSVTMKYSLGIIFDIIFGTINFI